MPRYFFHVVDDLDTVDHEGLELPNIEAAKAGAVEAARALICETVKDGHIALDHWIDIQNEAGVVLETVLFRDVIEIR